MVIESPDVLRLEHKTGISPDSGLTWAIENHNEIALNMRAEQDFFAIRGHDGFDPENRLLSEMGVCSWYDKFGHYLPLPKGYNLKRNRKIIVTDFTTGKQIHGKSKHDYFEKRDPTTGKKIILDFAAAQFFHPTYSADYDMEMERPEYRGHGVLNMIHRVLQAGREELYTVLSDDVAVLEGYADDIKEVLGLDYQ